jgi:hypothetical protein
MKPASASRGPTIGRSSAPVSHAEDDDVARHVPGEHAVEAEVADRIDHARREREREHEPEVRAGRVPAQG